MPLTMELLNLESDWEFKLACCRWDSISLPTVQVTFLPGIQSETRYPFRVIHFPIFLFFLCPEQLYGIAKLAFSYYISSNPSCGVHHPFPGGKVPGLLLGSRIYKLLAGPMCTIMAPLHTFG